MTRLLSGIVVGCAVSLVGHAAAAQAMQEKAPTDISVGGGAAIGGTLCLPCGGPDNTGWTAVARFGFPIARRVKIGGELRNWISTNGDGMNVLLASADLYPFPAGFFLTASFGFGRGQFTVPNFSSLATSCSTYTARGGATSLGFGWDLGNDPRFALTPYFAFTKMSSSSGHVVFCQSTGGASQTCGTYSTSFRLQTNEIGLLVTFHR